MIARLTLVASAVWCLFGAHTLARANGTTQAPSVTPSPITPGERLSQWFSRNGLEAADTTALHWRAPSEQLAQRHLRDHTVASLAQFGVAQPLREALAQLPPTGRLPLASPNPSALAAQAGSDPVLEEGHTVLLLPRPAHVAVLLSSGQVCLVPHQPLAFPSDYLQACNPGFAPAVETAWLAQPDAHTQSVGLAAWNATAQPHVAPGAWLWAPSRHLQLPAEVSDNLIRFLASQPPLELLQTQWSTSATPTAPPVPTPVAPQGIQLSYSDWGEAGLLQTPSARMAPAGNARFHFSRVYPYSRGTVMFQPLDWFEAGFRYTNVSNRLYGPEEFSGQQALKDKSIDVKFRLLPESSFWPQVAVGMRDIGGTGLFSGEYAVANKRWGNWDASLGLGWGYLGARGNIRNPLSRLLGANWASRPIKDAGQGGTVGFGTLFKGPTALFGGVQYTASPQLLLKAELDGNHYQSEPSSNNQPVKSRFNVGLTYRQTPHIDWSVGIERGNKLMLGFTVHTDAAGLGGLWAPKSLDFPLPPLVGTPNFSAFQRPLVDILDDVSRVTGWQSRILNIDHTTITIVAEAATAVYTNDRIEKATQFLNAHLPPQFTTLVFQLRELGMPMATVVVNRDEWLGARHQLRTPGSRLNGLELFAGNSGFKQFSELDIAYSNAGIRLAPSFHNVLGGPEGFILYSAGIQAVGEYRFDRGTWLAGSVNARLLDNFDLYRHSGASDLPRVRTYQREYATASRLTLPHLQLTHMADLGNGHYASAYAGMLEPMFGGVGGEWFYRPWMSRIAWGLDVNHVRQRDFRQNLSFRDYRTTTGHLTAYWDTGLQGLYATASVGRYLAGDVGATLDVKRVFQNGVALGAWATKTNVSAARFGEGSFDKGIYLTVPFDAMLPRSTPGATNLVWRPITRDGGAKLSRKYALDDITRLRSPSPWRVQWPGQADDSWFTGFSSIRQPSLPHPLSNMGQTTSNLGQQVAQIPANAWLLAGGAVLASSVLDSRADRWALSHSTGTWKTAGSLTSAIPFLLAGGAAALYTGIGGEGEATTAETAIRASVYTLAANLGLKYAVGRARPEANAGARSFNGFTGSAFNSSFASIHTSVAFALATPFAQQYDAPWLYAVAGATALGRIQQRQHWVSDTVGGALLGYAVGTMLSDQQLRSENKQGVSFSVTPNTVTAHWKY